MKKTLTKISGGSNDKQWTEATVEIENGRLSICGAYGRILSDRQAKREAFYYWTSFFEEDPSEIYEMRKRCPQFKGYSPKAAARFVIASDGPFHGLDVHKEDESGVWIVEGCGQCVEEMQAAFPQIAPLLPWHLNDLHAECAHQEKRGETYKNDGGIVCPDCGWKCGHEWCKRELPDAIVALAEAL